MDQNYIRNFSIIAHVDHGKSTLADRFIQMCGALSDREISEIQKVLTGLPVETDLSWSAGALATSHDAYLGTSTPLDAGDLQGNQAGTAFDPGPLAQKRSGTTA